MTSIFYFSHNIFNAVKEKCSQFHNIQIVVCTCYDFGVVYKCVIWERVKLLCATTLNLDKTKVFSTGIQLTHSHTMTPFDAPGKQAF